MKNTTLPQPYQDEMNLNKLSDPELQAKIESIETLRRDAAKYKEQWKHELALTLTKESHKEFQELKQSFPVYQELKDKRKEMGNDMKNVAQLEEELVAYRSETQQLKDDFAMKKKKFKSTIKERTEAEDLKAAKLEQLQEKLNPESPHAAYRKSIVEYAEKKENQETAEKIKGWAAKIEALRQAWKIKEDADGVSFGGFKTASKTVQKNALNTIQKTLGIKLLDSYWRVDHQWKQDRWTKKVMKQDLDTYVDNHGDQFGEFALWSNEQLTSMLTWIANEFEDATTRKEQVYILQMINPDLFERMWMKDVHWDYRSYIELSRYVNSRNINKYDSHDYGAGLFLVQNV